MRFQFLNNIFNLQESNSFSYLESILPVHEPAIPRANVYTQGSMFQNAEAQLL